MPENIIALRKTISRKPQSVFSVQLNLAVYDERKRLSAEQARISARWLVLDGITEGSESSLVSLEESSAVYLIPDHAFKSCVINGVIGSHIEHPRPSPFRVLRGRGSPRTPAGAILSLNSLLQTTTVEIGYRLVGRC